MRDYMVGVLAERIYIWITFMTTQFRSLCALLGSGIHHCGVKRKPAWHKRDSSIRAQLPWVAGACADFHSQ
eukprot:5512446-Amphidinium_carterae.3